MTMTNEKDRNETTTAFSIVKMLERNSCNMSMVNDSMMRPDSVVESIDEAEKNRLLLTTA